MTENRLFVDAVESTIHLHWSGTADLDLIALVQQGDAEYHLISFANEGSLEHNPFIQLVTDFAFEEVPADNQEILRIQPQKIVSPSRIWFFCWDFEHVESSSSAPFVDHDVSLELRQTDRIIRTNTIESNNGSGNTICLARWDVNPRTSDENSVLVEVNHPFHVPLMDGMPEVCEHLTEWVAQHQNV